MEDFDILLFRIRKSAVFPYKNAKKQPMRVLFKLLKVKCHAIFTKKNNCIFKTEIVSCLLVYSVSDADSDWNISGKRYGMLVLERVCRIWTK